MIKLDQWQKDYLACKGDRLLCTGRRVGKTYIMARGAIDRMRKKKTRVLLFSLTEEQAMLIIAMAKEYIKEVDPNVIKKKNTDTNKKTITLKNGSVMMCRAAGDTGDSGRGFEADILMVDEASRMGKFFWIAVRPIILMSAGEVWLASTPFGKQGYFWEMFDESYNRHEKDARFTVFYTTTEKVVKEREVTIDWNEPRREKILKTLEMDRKSMSKLEYGQEYQGLFMEDLMQFFPDDMITKAQTLGRPETIARELEYYAGQDIARMGDDQTSTEIGYMVEDEIFQVENLVTTKTFLTDTYKQNKQLNELYQFEKMFIDDEGIGVGVFDMMMDDDDLKYCTEGINNSKRIIDKDGKEKGILKTELYYGLRGMLESGKIHLLSDESIFNSLKSVQFEYKMDVKGQPIIRIFGNNTHIAEGLIRLAHAIKYKDLNISIHTIKV